jgi:phosphoribosylformimino-5-aminoimidazole carboxamide ribotide isomerase
MLIIPAIDLKDNKCVRLRQGRADDRTVYADDPVEVARRWAGEGADYLHVVDLDGAFQGAPVHTVLVERIIAAIDIPVEVGGGLRKDCHIRDVVDAGADRAIVGTRAVSSPETIGGMAAEFGRRLAVGIDARNGMVQVKGWVETTETKAADLAVKVDELGVKTIICTDTATDGMMRGINVKAIDDICGRVSCRVIASGGVYSVDDVRALRNLGHANLEGVIVGKALYEGGITLASLTAAA